uniref:Transcriptional accessory protein containing S1 RNA-binding domain n=1 Tax=Magnetococcus massalia (strain MO-1) TaxID=451514 RepID=A0A1S7LE50_MAGMO|nr:Transcriptional accessory protein containing S1 RNA-binding domain [Candidatus Magnetococcus massalia]
MKTISQRIAEELNVRDQQVIAAIELLDEGSTVPFIARYRKEVTGGLTDTHLRSLEERLGQLRELEERRQTILQSVAEQEQLTPQLEAALKGAETRTQLEDLYLPYRPKRRTKASVAREAGLEPLAQALLSNPHKVPEQQAQAYVAADREVPDVAAALEGARYILADIIAEDATLVGQLREELWNRGVVLSKLVKGKEQEGEKFSDYFDFSQPMKKLPSHRVLALMRGKEQGILRLSLSHEQDLTSDRKTIPRCEATIRHHRGLRDQGRPGDGWLMETIHHTWQKKLKPHLDGDLTKRLVEQAHMEAVRVFSSNLRDLLLAAPAGLLPVMGLDSGLRTGVKLAVVDETGQVKQTATIYPHAPRNRWQESQAEIIAIAKKHGVKLIAIGNGTGSRETDRLVAEIRKAAPELGITGVVVSEAGASVYSASEYASLELPELDVSLRGAVSIARRLQDPLAELVKIDPKSIGVGQYQHDVDPKQLASSLDGVVEDAVNGVGVDVNTASIPLLERVSGLNATLAKNIVAYRNANGQFRNRKALNRVPRFGPKSFQLAAGFLRIQNGDTPLDRSAVHPEAYPLVERIVKQSGTPLQNLLGNGDALRGLNPASFADGLFGEPTIRDIFKELEKPGRDPRPEFKTAAFKAGVEEMKDLQPGMVLEGVVSNVTNFGAFVDIGVHQDGLVHISAMADRFIKDPHEVVRAGEVVKVVVLEVELQRKRIALSMRLNDTPEKRQGGQSSQSSRPAEPRRPAAGQKKPSQPASSPMGGTMADAFKRAKQKR